MNLRIRRIIYIFFIISFFITTPLIILYALGYKYNWSKRVFQMTGAFFIKSFPKNAEIYLNNTKQNKHTPALINRLLPNYYTVKILKDGYLNWEKNLLISPQSTTFIEDVALFKKDPLLQIIVQGEFNNFIQSFDKNYVILTEKIQNLWNLWLFDIINGKMIKINNLPNNQEWQLISWSYNSRKILLKNNNNFYILNIDQRDYLYSLNKLTSYSFSQLSWDYYNDNILYGINNQKLYQINLLTNEINLLSNQPVLAAISYKTDLLAIVKDQNKYFLKFMKNEKNPLLAIPYSSAYSFYNPGFNLICLNDGEQQIMYLIEPENSNQPLKTYIKNIKYFQWHDDQFLYGNNNELWVYFPDINQQILVERTSYSITSAFWHPNVVYIFAIINNNLNAYELDSRDKRNIHTIFNFNQTANNFSFTNKKGDYLYLITSWQEKKGLFKLKIH